MKKKNIYVPGMQESTDTHTHTDMNLTSDVHKDLQKHLTAFDIPVSAFPASTTTNIFRIGGDLVKGLTEKVP